MKKTYLLYMISFLVIVAMFTADGVLALDDKIFEGDSEVEVVDTEDGYIEFIEDNSEIMRITSGKVGIGTASPGEKLEVSGVVKAGGFTDGYITMGLAQINRVGGAVELQYSGDHRVNIFGGTAYPITFQNGSGNVGIGTVSPSVLLHNNGDFITKGPWVDARAYNSGSFNDTTITAALTAIGTSQKTLLLAPGTWTISNPITVPSNVNLRFEQGAVLSISDQLVTINGPIDAPMSQIFGGSGLVSFGSGSVKEVYPQWWGAKGDGINDDSAALQKALDTYKVVHIPAVDSYYKVSKQGATDYALTVPSDTVIRGDGEKSIIRTSDDTIRIFSINSKSNIKIEKIHIYGGYAGSGGTNNGTGILVFNSNNVGISDCFIEYCSSGVYVMASDVWKSSRLYINDNKVSYCGYAGIALTANQAGTATDAISDFEITRNTVFDTNYLSAIFVQYGARRGVIADNIVINSNEHGILVDSSRDVVVSGNYCSGHTNSGICVAQTGASLPCYNVNVTGNVVTSCGSLNPDIYGGIYVTALSDSLHDINISGNTSYGNNGHGLSLVPTANSTADNARVVINGNIFSANSKDGINLGYCNGNGTTNFNISNNTIRGNSERGIFGYGLRYGKISNNKIFENTKTGILLAVTSYLTIDGNEVYNNDYGDSNTYSGIKIESGDDNIIRGNKIYNSGAAGQIYGIQLDANARWTMVANNYLFSNETSPIFDSGQWTVFSKNVTSHDGLNGSFTMASAANLTIANVNVQTYSRILIMPTNSTAATLMGSNKSLYISAKNANTSFRVTTANGGNAAGTETFDYMIE